MHDLDPVHTVEAPDHLDEDLPYLPLLDVRLALLVVANLLEDVAVVRKLHDDAVGKEKC